MDNKGKRSGITDDHDASTRRYSAFIAYGLMMIMITIFWDNVQPFWMSGKYFMKLYNKKFSLKLAAKNLEFC